MQAKSLQSCLTPCDPMNCRPPVFLVHGILQARTLEWVAMSSSRGIFLTQGSKPGLLRLLHCRWLLYPKPLVKPANNQRIQSKQTNKNNNKKHKTNKPVKKQVEDLNISPKKTYRWSKAHEMLNISNYQRNANQNYNEVSPHTDQNGHHQKIYKH